MSTAQHLAASRRRRASTRVRRTRAVTVLVIVAIALGFFVDRQLSSPTGQTHRSVAHTTGAHQKKKAPIPAVESGLLPWQLAAPISRVVVLPGSGSQLDILGGLTSGNTSSSGAYSLDTSDGTLRQIGGLSGPLHDAAGAVIGGQDVVFGGGLSSTVATVQAFPPPAAATPVTHGPTASVVGSLPSPRSDAADVAVGATNYIVGGYDGTNPDPVVLATTDGHTCRSVASLPVPVRYPAVAVVGGKIYTFGGQAITGAGAGDPVTSVQMIDPTHHTATVVGHLPEPLSGAAAVTLAGHIYVVGGESTSAQTSTPGVGSTQTTSPGSGSNPGVGASGATPDSYRPNGHVDPGPANVLTAALAPAPTNTVATIWAFDPISSGLVAAGHLQVPVSHAGVAVIGTTAWLIGGESAGTPVTATQMMTPNPAFGVAGAPGAGSP